MLNAHHLEAFIPVSTEKQMKRQRWREGEKAEEGNILQGTDCNVNILVSLFNGISIFVGYLMPKPCFQKNSCGAIQPIVGVR